MSIVGLIECDELPPTTPEPLISASTPSPTRTLVVKPPIKKAPSNRAGLGG